MLDHLRTAASGLRHLLFAALASALLVACGGGVGVGGTGTFSYTTGSIAGFGSVIVGGVRFDDSAARVEDEDGTLRRSDDLRLGMTVEVEAGEVTPGAAGALSTARADRIRYVSEMTAPVASVDVAGSRFVALGQTVIVAPSTVFDERLAGGLAALSAGDRVRVHGRFDAATGAYRATRVEPVEVAIGFVLRGVVSGLDAGSRVFRIGGATFDYRDASGVPSGLANGRIVRVMLAEVPDGLGRWVVLRFGAGREVPQDADEARIEGRITAIAAPTSFSVDGVAVDASAARFPDGTAGLVLGAKVEVEGRIVAGTLRAVEVGVESEAEENDREYEVSGRISAVSTATASFVIRGITVLTSNPELRIEPSGRTVADVLNWTGQLEVKGRLSADGTRLLADRIELED